MGTYGGWYRVELPGHQLHRRFRTEAGLFRYGLLPLEQESESDIAEPQTGSNLHFAVINCASANFLPVPGRIPAMRWDLDFYVLWRINAAHRQALADALGPDPACLCLYAEALPLEADAEVR